MGTKWRCHFIYLLYHVQYTAVFLRCQHMTIASLHTFSGCKRKEAHNFLYHCIKLFCRALQNRGMVDCVRLRPFNSSGSTLLGPEDVLVLNTIKGLKAYDDLFHFISSINYSINISVTATVKAEARTSASQDFQSVQILAHDTRVTGSPQFITCSLVERVDSVCVMKWRKLLLRQIKWFAICSRWALLTTQTKQNRESSTERDFVLFHHKHHTLLLCISNLLRDSFKARWNIFRGVEKQPIYICKTKSWKRFLCRENVWKSYFGICLRF